jgi:dihydrofolate synthase/folylpolyglutamate synthase
MDPMAWLGTLDSYERTGRLTRPTLDRITALASALGNPQLRYPVIHVTGTNGKGSTTAMIARLLTEHGLRVGTYTSPHVERLGERIALDGRPATDDELSRAIGQVATAAGQTGVTPSWFEAITAAGLFQLARWQVDVAVVEVGMLGTWDATNIVPGRVAVVTNIALDHTDMAGPTRTAIATEKAGIVKPGATLVLGESDRALWPIFTARRPGRVLARGRELNWRARDVGIGGSVVDLSNPWGTREGIRIGLRGRHQCDNALLALTAAEAFLDEAIPNPVVDRALAATRLPGRFEIAGSDPVVIVDGAHNPAGAAALARAVDDTVGDARPRVLLYGALAGRDPAEFLRSFGMDRVDLVITTEPNSPRALPAVELANTVRAAGTRAISVADPAGALVEAAAAAGAHGVVVVTGSLYLTPLTTDTYTPLRSG